MFKKVGNSVLTECGCMMQQPGWDRLRWEFIVSKRAVHQTRRITRRPSSEVAGKVLLAAGGGDRAASGKGHWVFGGRCLPESIQRIFWINIKLGKNILQCIDELILVLPTSNLQACKGEDLGKVEFDEEIKKRFKMVYVPNWFSVDLKTGVSPNLKTQELLIHQLLAVG